MDTHYGQSRNWCFLHRRVNGQQALEQGLKILKIQRICTIGFSIRRVVVYFEEDAVHAGGDRRPG